MDHFSGLDVSVKETRVCVVDDTGRIVREVKVASEPEALLEDSQPTMSRWENAPTLRLRAPLTTRA